MIVIPQHITDDPIWDYAGPTLVPLWVRGRWEHILYAADLERFLEALKPDPCPGEGRCHGCPSWCAWCGTVSDVCDAEWPDHCDRHQRYPAKPEQPKPDPRQLYLPGLGVTEAHGREL